MEAAAFSTGVSIQWPHGSSASNHASAYREGASSYPFALPDSSNISSARQYKTDTQDYSACQELAYRFACEKTRSAVQAVLHSNNSSCYGQILRFFERYCERDVPLETKGTTVSPGRRDPNAPVLFPAFHGFPTAAVIAGADATASDLWVDPLTLTLKRTFPLCLSVPRDVVSARRFVEWLAARMAKLRDAKKREERWLNGQVEEFDLLPLDRPPVSAAGGSVARRVTRNHRAKASEKQKEDENQKSDGNYGVESSDDAESNDNESRGGKGRKRRRPAVVYGRWTMSKLLTSIQSDITEVLSPSGGEGSRQLVAMIGELVEEHLQRALAEVRKVQQNEEEALVQSIQCFDEAVEWLQHRVSECREKAASTLNVATSSSAIAATMHGGSTELALALVLQSVLRQYAMFLKTTKLEWKGMNDRRKDVAQKLSQHEYKYELLRASTKKDDELPSKLSSAPRPFLMLCIEQLEVFSQHVLGDFLEIWTHFVRHQNENLQSSGWSCNLGFIVGVASAASPALRRLDLTVTSRLEVQFFSLVDSRNCFNDVLESLVVNANLPLALSGRVLRTISSRHQRLPSVPRLLLALRFLLFTHLRRYPWSFLALAVNPSPHSGESPILAAEKVARLPYQHRVSVWLRRWHRHLNHETRDGRTTSTSTLTAWLVPFADTQLADLAAQVKSSNSAAEVSSSGGDWIEMLDAALLNTRRLRARWRLGWHCFRAACTWLDIPLCGDNSDGLDNGEDLSVVPLALALDGRLGEAACFSEVLRRLQHCSQWNLLSPLVQDWQSSFRRFAILEDEGEDLDTKLSELVLLCEYTASEKPPANMQVALRQELSDMLTDHLVPALLYPPVPGVMSPADKLVAKWTVLTDASVLDERLRFEYHDKLHNVLEEAGIGDRGDAVSDTSWVHDVGLAFLFYTESASASLSLSEWYNSFSTELMEEAKPAQSKNKKRKKTEDDTEIKARFVRAICTLRQWGFLKSDAPRDLEQDIVEKLVFI